MVQDYGADRGRRCRVGIVSGWLVVHLCRTWILCHAAGTLRSPHFTMDEDRGFSVVSNCSSSQALGGPFFGEFEDDQFGHFRLCGSGPLPGGSAL
jgi:hypothetical protein